MLKKSLFFVSLDSEMVHTHINDKERKKHTTDHTYIYSISSLMPEKASWYISYENTTFTFEKYLDWFEEKKWPKLWIWKHLQIYMKQLLFNDFGDVVFFTSDNRRTQTCPNQKEKHCLAIRDTDTKIIKYSSAIWKP